jgi:hypothetical protein
MVQRNGLDGDFRQYIHPPYLGGHAEVSARTLFHA